MRILEARDLFFEYKEGIPILQNVNFSIESGEIVCLLGPNGCGKSTLLTQLLFPTNSNEKKIFVFGQPYRKFSRIERANMIGFVPQRIQAQPLTVLQTVVLGRASRFPSLFLKPEKRDVEIAQKWIAQMGLEAKADTVMTNLSGGEIQRVFLAHALAKEAPLYVFDEPMSALDVKYQNSFLRLMETLTANGVSILFTTHNPNHLFSLKGCRAGIIDAEKHYRELNLSDENDINRIETTFEHAVEIRYDKASANYAAMFVDEGLCK